MRRSRWAWAGVAAAMVVVVAAPVGLAHEQDGLAAIGLANRGTTIVGFDTAEPADTEPIGPLTGFTLGDTMLVGIDFRPQSGSLFGVGNAGGIYRVNTGNAAVTRVGGVTLSGTFFGIDFNPTSGALRIVSDTGQNLRVPFVGDTPGLPVADTALDRNGISAAAYTDNDVAAATGTALFDIDTIGDQLVLQDPPNAGTTTDVGPVGSLGDLVGYAGLDIYSELDPAGVAVDSDAYAVVALSGVPTLLTVSLDDGSAASRGAFDVTVTDLAIRLVQ